MAEAPSSRSERLLAAKAAAWQVEPVSRITFAAGGTYCCPDKRCGEDMLGIVVPHPDDPTQTPNRCPTCLATVGATDARERELERRLIVARALAAEHGAPLGFHDEEDQLNWDRKAQAMLRELDRVEVVPRSEAEALAEALERIALRSDGDVAHHDHAQRLARKRVDAYRSRHPKGTR